MPSRPVIRPPRDRAEALALGWLVVHELSPLAQPTSDDVDTFVDRTGMSRMRLAMRSGEVLGGLVLLDMGQFFGGRAVPMTGVSAVVVSAPHRGTGIASALLRASLREMSARGIALSGLYPATVPLYRGLGWEFAGARTQWRIPTRLLALGERSLALRRMLAEDRAALHSCHHAWASRRPGMLDRIDWNWRRVLESPDAEVRAHVVEAPDGRGIQGHVVATREPRGSGHDTELIVRDLVALDERALRRLLTFLGDHSSIASSTRLVMGPGDPLQLMLSEASRELVAERPWMSRVVNVTAAMAARGFDASASVALAVEIDDAELPECAGRFELSCRAGRGRATRSRRKPDVSLHARGLAAAFTGHASGADLAAAGLAAGSASSLDRLTAMFAGPAPWTLDTW